MSRPWDSLSPDERARRVRDYLAAAHASCPECGYDLFGLEGPACPECAAPIDCGAFAFLADERDDKYEARRLHEYLAKNQGACPGCNRPLEHVEGRTCPHCKRVLEVWELVPCGLPGGRRSRIKWAVVIAVLYIVLSAGVGALILYLNLR